MGLFHSETFDLSAPPMDLTDYATVVLAYRSILRMKAAWISLKIMALIKEHPTYIYDRVCNILATYTDGYSYGQFVEAEPGRLVMAALRLIMAHNDLLEDTQIFISNERLTL